MSEVIQKISNYNIFNYLFQGEIMCYFLEKFHNYNIFHTDIIINVFICYFIGLCISRVGSLFFDKFFEIIGFINKETYKDFIEASKKDDKIELFSEISNTYRTLLTLFSILIIIKLFQSCPNQWVIQDCKYMGLLVGFLILFLFSYKKQVKYTTKRIKNALGEQNGKN